MKSIIFCLALALSTTLYGQSKKELQAEVASLKAEATKLKAEIEELKKPKEAQLTNDQSKACYGLGVLMASSLKKQGGDSIDIDLLTIGVRDVFTNRPLKMQEQEALPFVQSYMQKVMEQKTAFMKEGGVKFLNANKSRAGVVVTPSGLQYEVIKTGTGKVPTTSSSVTVHYTGKLTDGTVFESSVSRGEPITMAVTQFIAGWIEALQLMHEGDKWILYIPSELAYGERGGGQIPPHAALIFELELIKVQ